MTPTLNAGNLESTRALVEEANKFTTFRELRNSGFYRTNKTELRRILDEPRIYEYPGCRPRLKSFLRVVEWNIQRGSQLDGIVETLNSHPVLRFADLLLLNELDDGMIRSRNLNVPQELTRALQAHAVFGVEYLELTKGVGDEAYLQGQNSRSLHGNAILTRSAFLEPRIVRLPRCENNFESTERRIGGRIGILLTIDVGGTLLMVANTHLDVTNTPRCRARQMRAMLREVDDGLRLKGAMKRAVIVGGDLNTHTFARGNRFRALLNTAIILNGSKKRLGARLSNPEELEPAIGEFANFGYATRGFNDEKATSRSIVSNLDDTSRLPRPVKQWINRRIPPEGLVLEFRLDWLAARGLRALSAGEITDHETGVESVAAQTFQGLSHKGFPLSDHDPIVFDVVVRR